MFERFTYEVDVSATAIPVAIQERLDVKTEKQQIHSKDVVLFKAPSNGEDQGDQAKNCCTL